MEKNKNTLILVGIWIVVAIVLIYAVFAIFLAKDTEEVGEKIPTENKVEEQQVAPEDAIAQIDNIFYPTIQKAIDDVKDDGFERTIKILKSTNENILVGANKNIVIEGNDNTITSLDYMKPVLTIEGKLTLKNINFIGECKNKVPSIDIKRSAQLDFDNSTVNRKSNEEFSSETIAVNGILNVKSGKIMNERTVAIYIYSNEEIEVNIQGNSEVFSKQDFALVNSGMGKVKIQGGKFESEGGTIIYNQKDGKMTIDNGVINSVQGRAIDNAGILNIGGVVEISSAEQQTIYNQNTGVIVVSGGYIKSNTAITIDNRENAQLTVSGGTIVSETGNAIYNLGILNINEGANIFANGEESPTVYNQASGRTVVKGGIVQNRANNYDIYNNGGAVEDINKIIVKNNWTN